MSSRYGCASSVRILRRRQAPDRPPRRAAWPHCDRDRSAPRGHPGHARGAPRPRPHRHRPPHRAPSQRARQLAADTLDEGDRVLYEVRTKGGAMRRRELPSPAWEAIVTAAEARGLRSRQRRGLPTVGLHVRRSRRAPRCGSGARSGSRATPCGIRPPSCGGTLGRASRTSPPSSGTARSPPPRPTSGGWRTRRTEAGRPWHGPLDSRGRALLRWRAGRARRPDRRSARGRTKKHERATAVTAALSHGEEAPMMPTYPDRILPPPEGGNRRRIRRGPAELVRLVRDGSASTASCPHCGGRLELSTVGARWHFDIEPPTSLTRLLLPARHARARGAPRCTARREVRRDRPAAALSSATCRRCSCGWASCSARRSGARGRRDPCPQPSVGRCNPESRRPASDRPGHRRGAPTRHPSARPHRDRRVDLRQPSGARGDVRQPRQARASAVDEPRRAPDARPMRHVGSRDWRWAMSAYYRLETIHGYPLDEVASALRKAIEGSQVDEAMWCAVEQNEWGLGAYCWRRLMVIVNGGHRDCRRLRGSARQRPVGDEQEIYKHDRANATSKERVKWNGDALLHAVWYLAKAAKSREMVDACATIEQRMAKDDDGDPRLRPGHAYDGVGRWAGPWTTSTRRATSCSPRPSSTVTSGARPGRLSGRPQGRQRLDSALTEVGKRRLVEGPIRAGSADTRRRIE